LKEIIELTQEAFNLADKYQIPVIIMSDKYLSESRFSTSIPIDKIKIKIDRGKRYARDSKIYSRYKITKDGVSARAYPGETAFLTNSYEHDEKGFSIDDAETRRKMVAKRAKKLGKLAGGFEVLGNKKSARIIVGWGSTKTQMMEFILNYPELKYIHIWRPWPFPEEIKNEIKKAQKVIVVENNFSGQMAKIIQNETGIEPDKILKDDGRPFFKEELAELIKNKI
jgi:2-oxoglutarate ferredoxin oxidoreductase subunit alpha